MKRHPDRGRAAPWAVLGKETPLYPLGPVSLCLARASGPRRLLLQLSGPCSPPSPSGAIMDVSWGPPTTAQAGRVQDGPVPLNSRLSLPWAAVPAGLCPQFQPLAVCPPRAVSPACDTELSGACGPWGSHRHGLPGECGCLSGEVAMCGGWPLIPVVLGKALPS